MNATAQVQAQIHRVRADCSQPVGRGGQQVQGDGIGGFSRIRIECLLDQVASLDLDIRAVKAHPNGTDWSVLLERGPGMGDVGLAQDALHAIKRGGIYFQCCFGA